MSRTPGSNTKVCRRGHAGLVVSSFDPARLEAQAADLRRLAGAVPLALAGPGATDELSARLGARRLDGDLVAAADEVART